jgi:hypothetical protein
MFISAIFSVLPTLLLSKVVLPLLKSSRWFSAIFTRSLTKMFNVTTTDVPRVTGSFDSKLI